MKILSLVLFYILITCQSSSISTTKKEIVEPILPTEWLSQIQNQEAKNRFIDVLEEIYASSFFSISEKDSLSKVQVRFANCEDIETQYKLFAFLTQQKEDMDSLDVLESKKVAWIKRMYLKDKIVATQSLKALVGTTRLDFADYSSQYYDTTYYPKKSFDSLWIAEPSEKVKKMELEAISLIKELRRLSDYELEGMSYEERHEKYDKTRQELSEKVKTLLQEPTAYEYALPLLSEQMNCLYSPNKKFRIYFINYHLETFKGVYAYAHYRNSADSKVMIEEVDCPSEDSEDGECYPLYPRAIFQTKKGNNPLYILVSDISGRGMEWRVKILALEIKDNTISNCKDCVEGMPTKMYDKHVRYNASPAFDTLKQELSFSYAELRNRVIDLHNKKRMWTSYNTVLTRYILKWNGKTFEEVELKPYCE